MSQPSSPWLSPEVLDRILELGQVAAPREACGIVSPDLQVTGLPNTSECPESSYGVQASDLVEAIEAYVDRSGVDPLTLTRGHFIVWHTHPGGLVGPSRGDLETKLEGFIYVVVTMPGGQASQF